MVKFSKTVLTISGMWLLGILPILAGGSLNVGTKFTASGWMGDGEKGPAHVQLLQSYNEGCHSKPTCVSVAYTPGEARWAAVCWQNQPDNWGDAPGKNLEKPGFQRLSLWAKGEKGGEVVEFKAGGIDVAGKRFKDSFEVSTGNVVLTNQWTQYTLDLADMDLSSVIGGFCWAVTEPGSSSEVRFYLDDIQYER